jgi:predicted HNH restriction endonuclease
MTAIMNEKQRILLCGIECKVCSFRNNCNYGKSKKGFIFR